MALYVREYDWMWTQLELSLAECRVFAYIYGLTNKKSETGVKGYCGSKRQLASSLGLDCGATKRILDMLEEKHLIVCIDGLWQSVVSGNVSVVTDNASVVSGNVSVATDNIPEPPINKINNMEINENNARAQLRTAQPQNSNSFESLLKAFTLRVGNIKLADSTRDECLRMWSDYPEWKRKMLITRLQNGSWLKPRLDWLISDFNPQPTDYNKKALPDEPVCIAKWNGKWGMYTVREAQEFGMERG